MYENKKDASIDADYYDKFLKKIAQNDHVALFDLLMNKDDKRYKEHYQNFHRQLILNHLPYGITVDTVNKLINHIFTNKLHHNLKEVAVTCLRELYLVTDILIQTQLQNKEQSSYTLACYMELRTKIKKELTNPLNAHHQDDIKSHKKIFQPLKDIEFTMQQTSFLNPYGVIGGVIQGASSSLITLLNGARSHNEIKQISNVIKKVVTEISLNRQINYKNEDGSKNLIKQFKQDIKDVVKIDAEIDKYQDKLLLLSGVNEAEYSNIVRNNCINLRKINQLKERKSQYQQKINCAISNITPEYLTNIHIKCKIKHNGVSCTIRNNALYWLNVIYKGTKESTCINSINKITKTAYGYSENIDKFDVDIKSLITNLPEIAKLNDKYQFTTALHKITFILNNTTYNDNDQLKVNDRQNLLYLLKQKTQESLSYLKHRHKAVLKALQLFTYAGAMVGDTFADIQIAKGSSLLFSVSMQLFPTFVLMGEGFFKQINHVDEKLTFNGERLKTTHVSANQMINEINMNKQFANNTSTLEDFHNDFINLLQQKNYNELILLIKNNKDLFDKYGDFIFEVVFDNQSDNKIFVLEYIISLKNDTDDDNQSQVRELKKLCMVNYVQKKFNVHAITNNINSAFEDYESNKIELFKNYLHQEFYDDIDAKRAYYFLYSMIDTEEDVNLKKYFIDLLTDELEISKKEKTNWSMLTQKSMYAIITKGLTAFILCATSALAMFFCTPIATILIIAGASILGDMVNAFTNDKFKIRKAQNKLIDKLSNITPIIQNNSQQINVGNKKINPIEYKQCNGFFEREYQKYSFASKHEDFSSEDKNDITIIASIAFRYICTANSSHKILQSLEIVKSYLSEKYKESKEELLGILLKLKNYLLYPNAYLGIFKSINAFTHGAINITQWIAIVLRGFMFGILYPLGMLLHFGVWIIDAISIAMVGGVSVFNRWIQKTKLFQSKNEIYKYIDSEFAIV